MKKHGLNMAGFYAGLTAKVSGGEAVRSSGWLGHTHRGEVDYGVLRGDAMTDPGSLVAKSLVHLRSQKGFVPRETLNGAFLASEIQHFSLTVARHFSRNC